MERQRLAPLGPRRIRPSGPHTGVVVQWQQRDGAWFALIAYLIEADGVLVQRWLSADLLTRIG